MYLYKFFWVVLSDGPTNPLANEISTKIGPAWLPFEVLYENIIQSNNSLRNSGIENLKKVTQT